MATLRTANDGQQGLGGTEFSDDGWPPFILSADGDDYAGNTRMIQQGCQGIGDDRSADYRQILLGDG